MSKPGLTARSGPAPTGLVISDLTVDDGKETTPGARVEAHYAGVNYETSEEFDSSWNRGQSTKFPLNDLIADWQEGIPGTKVGGRRRLICPPEGAYDPADTGHFLSGKTLIFVINLLDVR